METSEWRGDGRCGSRLFCFNEAEALETSECETGRPDPRGNPGFNEAEALETSEYETLARQYARDILASMRPRLWRPRNLRPGRYALNLLRCFNEAEALETSESRKSAAIYPRVQSRFNEAEALETSESRRHHQA